MSKLKLRVIAPTMATDKNPYKVEENVDMVIMRCTTGDMGILPGRVPCSMVLDNGVLRVFDEEKVRRMAILGGIAHVDDDIVTILSDSAQKPEEINAAQVTNELKELRRLHDETADLHEKDAHKKEIRRCQVLLEVAEAE